MTAFWIVVYLTANFDFTVSCMPCLKLCITPIKKIWILILNSLNSTGQSPLRLSRDSTQVVWWVYCSCKGTASCWGRLMNCFLYDVFIFFLRILFFSEERLVILRKQHNERDANISSNNPTKTMVYVVSIHDRIYYRIPTSTL